MSQIKRAFKKNNKDFLKFPQILFWFHLFMSLYPPFSILPSSAHNKRFLFPFKKILYTYTQKIQFSPLVLKILWICVENKKHKMKSRTEQNITQNGGCWCFISWSSKEEEERMKKKSFFLCCCVASMWNRFSVCCCLLLLLLLFIFIISTSNTIGNWNISLYFSFSWKRLIYSEWNVYRM